MKKKLSRVLAGIMAAALTVAYMPESAVVFAEEDLDSENPEATEIVDDSVDEIVDDSENVEITEESSIVTESDENNVLYDSDSATEANTFTFGEVVVCEDEVYVAIDNTFTVHNTLLSASSVVTFKG